MRARSRQDSNDTQKNLALSPQCLQLRRMLEQPYHSSISPQSVAYIIKKAQSLMIAAVQPMLTAHRFTFLQYQIIASLREGFAVSPRDICAQYRHDNGALTRVIDQLADRGLLKRVRQDRDRRKVKLELTLAGVTSVERLVPRMIEELNLALADFSSSEVHELTRLLLKTNCALLHRATIARRIKLLRHNRSKKTIQPARQPRSCATTPNAEAQAIKHINHYLTGGSMRSSDCRVRLERNLLL